MQAPSKTKTRVAGTTARRCTSTTASRLAQTVRAHAEAIRRHAAGARLSPDPDSVHDMRVACRRLNATLKSFEASAGGSLARRVRNRIVRLTRRMGVVRDYDVFVVAMQARVKTLPPTHQHVLALRLAQWQRDREKLHARLSVTLQAHPFTALLHALDTLIRRLGSTATTTPGDTAARTRIRRLLKRTCRRGRTIGRNTPDTRLHRLRIDCKKLRYACECLAAVCSDATARFATHTARLQAVLGHHQDLSMEAKRLRTALVSPAAKRTPALRRALKAMLAQVTSEQRHSRKACLKAWQRFDRHPSHLALLRRLK